MAKHAAGLGTVVDVDPVSGIRWVMIPAGSIKTKRGDVLTVARPFLMAETTVTQGQWIRVMSGQGLIVNNPSHHKGDANLPVESVTALEADEFSRRVGGRLPTEEEWEYAALGGQEADPYGPILDIAWVYENSGGKTHPVGLKLPNAFGLYDMLGNVMQWTSTKVTGANRVTRGGGWVHSAWGARASRRTYGTPGDRFSYLGFRPVKDLPSTYGKTRVELLEMDETKDLPSVPSDSMRIRMLELDGLGMPRPAAIFERRTPTAIGPGTYAKRVLTYYARKTPERVRTAIATQISERYRRTVRLDLQPVTAAEVIRHLIAAASSQTSAEAPEAYGTEDADRVWERRRNEILLDWGLAPSMLPPRAM